jgi:oligopeptide transport system substrate-binding protein
MGKISYNKFFILFLLLSFSLFYYYSCSPSDKGGTREKVLRFAISTEPPTLDPNLATDSVSHLLINNLQCGLTRFDTEKLKPVPCLAESFEYQDEGTKVVFKLKKAFWSDGKPLSAYDFVYSWRRLLSPETGAEYAYFLYDLVGAYEFNTGKISYFPGVTAESDDTLVVYLKRPIAYLPSIVSFMVTFPIRQDVIERCKEKWTEPECYPEIGPFILSEWKHEYKIVLKPNPYWIGEKPKVERVELFVVSDAATALNLYRSNFIYAVGLFPLAIRKFRNSPEFITNPGMRGFYVGFNVTKKPFDNVHVRRAFAYATNREAVVRALGGIQIPATSWIPPGMLAHNPNIGLPFDPQKAKEELKKAGYPDGKGFPEVRLFFNHSPENRKISEVLKETWRSVLGIDVKLESMEWKMFLSTLVNQKPELFRLGWGADFPDPHNFMDLFTSQSGNNHTGFANKRYDELIMLASEELNEEKRIQLYNEAQKILLEEEVAIIPLFWGVSAILKKPFIKIKFNPLDIIYYDEVEFIE